MEPIIHQRKHTTGEGEVSVTYLLEENAPDTTDDQITSSPVATNNNRGVLRDVWHNVYKRVYVAHADRPDLLLFVLAAFFFVNTTTAELISGKLFLIGPFTISIGSVMWPVVFVLTDLTNEFFGKKLVRRLSIIMATLLVYIYVLLAITIQIPAAEFSPVTQSDYAQVFGQSNWIIVGSLVAFMVGQLIDITIYHILRTKTKGKHLWLRSTGSNLVSQLVDTFVVSAIAFLLPGKISVLEYLNLATVSYVYKVLVAILLIPIIYIAHHVVDWFLGKELAEQLIAKAVQASNEDSSGNRGSLERTDSMCELQPSNTENKS